MRITAKSRLLAGLAALPVLLAACDGSASAPTPAATSTPVAAPLHARVYAVSGGEAEDIPPERQYTQADYDYLSALHALGYGAMSTADFARAVADWSDEEAFHRSEAHIQRLFYSLPESDPLYPFLNATFSRSWTESRLKHYNACAHGDIPTYDHEVRWERYEDVYGDKVLTASAGAWYWLDYAIQQEDVFTVAERDAFLDAVDSGMQAFLNGQDETALKDEKAMEQALKNELKRLCTGQSSGISVPAWELNYYWDGWYG